MLIPLTDGVNAMAQGSSVDIQFGTTQLQRACNSGKEMALKWGPGGAKKLRQRLDELQAAPSLEVMRRLPGRCHELNGNRAGQLSLDLVHPQRLIFEPSNNPLPRKSDGGLDWGRVTAVRILGVVDTHA